MEQCQALVLFAKQQFIQFRFVSFIYQQNIKVWRRPEQELLVNFNEYSKSEIAFLYVLYVKTLGAHNTLKKIFVRLVKPICGTMCLRRTSSLEFFSTLFMIIITVSSYRCEFVQTCLVRQPSVRYRFQVIFCEFKKCRCFVLMRCTNYITYLEEIQTKNMQTYWIVVILVLIKCLVVF